MLGIDIGGTKCALSLGTDPETIVRKKMIPTNHDVPAITFLDHLIEECDCLVRSADAETYDLDRIGVVCGGPLDISRGMICSPPNLPGWDDIEIVSMLESQFSVPVWLQNDADASAVAEWSFGAGRNCETMVFLTFGTGMGAGLIINSRLFRGTTMSAGEVGRIRLSDPDMQAGCDGTFEGFCSGNGIARRARARARAQFEANGSGPLYCPDLESIYDVSARSVADAARSGDPDAQELFHETAVRLGEGLATILDILNPERVVIGGIYGRCLDLLEDVSRITVQELADPHSFAACDILPCALGEHVGDVAALSVAAGMLDTDRMNAS